MYLVKAFVISTTIGLVLLTTGILLGACSQSTSTPPSVLTVLNAVETACKFVPTAASVENLIAAAIGNPIIVGGVVTANTVATAVCAALPSPVAAVVGDPNDYVKFEVGGVPIEGYRK